MLLSSIQTLYLYFLQLSKNTLPRLATHINSSGWPMLLLFICITACKMRLLAIYLMCFFTVVLAGKEKSSKRKQSSNSRFPPNGTINNPSCVANIPARFRTLDEWKSMSREALVLSLNSLNLPIVGSDQTLLAERLYEHYHAGPSSSTSSQGPGEVQSVNLEVNTSTNSVSPTDIQSIVCNELHLSC